MVPLIENILIGVHTMEKENSKKAYEFIIDHIKSDVLNGKLHLGDKLPPERELAKQFSVSRTSIREALRTLEILGVIESIQGSGNFIADNFKKSMVESMSMMFLLQQIDDLQISQLREALETKAGLLAIENINTEQSERLENIILEMDKTTDEDINIALDKELHYTIAAASKNNMIIQILDTLSEVIEMDIKDRRREILTDKSNRPRLQQIHHQMVYSIINKDVNKTYQAFMSHFEIISQYIGKG